MAQVVKHYMKLIDKFFKDFFYKTVLIFLDLFELRDVSELTEAKRYKIRKDVDDNLCLIFHVNCFLKGTPK